MSDPGRIPPGAHLLVTGGAGFIGSELVRRLLARDEGTRVTVLDLLTYAGNRANLADVEADPAQAARFTFVRGDIADPDLVGPLVAEADAVINVAAETHVDRSILDPEAFLRTGVIGVHVLLEAVRREAGRVAAGDRAGSPRFVQVSTDEVYGDIAEGRSVEDDPLAPRSPYAAAKAASELLVRAYRITYGIDTVVTRGSNTYGPHQHPEKLIPLFVTNALAGEPLPMYGDGLQVRDWLHVSDHASGIEFVLRHGEPGETYNLPGGTELPNR
jgi:dTDP-glucose 4,6-dehydratase